VSRRLFLISMVSVLILQCFVFSNVIATPEKKLEIIYQYSNDNNKAGFEALISKFEELYPNVEVNKQAIHLSDFSTVLQTRVASNDLPDVAIATPGTVPDLAAKGVLADITPYVGADFLDAFPSSRALVDRYGEAIVGAPLATSVRAVAYNKTVLDAAGIKAPGVGDEPWTWEEIVSVAQKIQDLGLVTYGLQFEKPSFDGWLPFLYQNGGSLFDAQGEVAINNAAGIEAIAWTVKLHKDGLAAPGVLEGTDDGLRLFVSGQVGIWMNTGPFNVATLEKQVTDFEYSFTFCPRQAINTTILGGSDVVAFNTPNVETSAAFIALATSKEYVTLATNVSGGLPARTDADNVSFLREDLVDILLKQGEYMNETLVEQYLTGTYGASKDQMLRELQSAVIGEVSAEEAANNMAEILRTNK
jgi:multiple sugar transport system substrate-binding protein